MSAQSLLRDSSCAQNTAHKSLPTQKNTKLYGRHRTPYNLVFIWCFNLQNGQLRKVTIHIFERHKSPQYRTFRNFRLRYGSDKLLLETEYFDTEHEYDGLNEDAFNCVLEIDLAEVVRECNVNDYNAIIYEYGERTYLCWSITEEHSCILEYSPDFISEDEIFKMAESCVRQVKMLAKGPQKG